MALEELGGKTEVYPISELTCLKLSSVTSPVRKSHTLVKILNAMAAFVLKTLCYLIFFCAEM